MGIYYSLVDLQYRGLGHSVQIRVVLILAILTLHGILVLPDGISIRCANTVCFPHVRRFKIKFNMLRWSKTHLKVIIRLLDNVLIEL